jgi:hypothetical protein
LINPCSYMLRWYDLLTCQALINKPLKFPSYQHLLVHPIFIILI